MYERKRRSVKKKERLNEKINVSKKEKGEEKKD